MKQVSPTLEFNKQEVSVPFEIHTMEWIELNRKEQNEQPHRHNTAPRNLETVRHFFSLIEKQYTTKKMASDYADELAVTPNYLNELAKNITGHPASYHVQQRIVLESKRMLAFSNLSMKEIAYELGFDDSAHFSKYFKNVSGQNFTDYKASIQKETSKKNNNS